MEPLTQVHPLLVPGVGVGEGVGEGVAVAVGVEPLELDPEPQLAMNNKVSRISNAPMAREILGNMSFTGLAAYMQIPPDETVKSVILRSESR